ncbi:virulence factor Mce family protein [Patulibacter medicamentivorans]|uniref:Virulence factor Mce family protein n=2 Tax=Patulibacter medicamentivorans TaxID=1097667 RepID=H0E4W7_9ACTN|nr:virulence factor Mce family protein [Patulibacter medicamentivorans]
MFALLSMGIAVAIWRSFGGTVPFEAKGYQVSVEVPEADALFANSDVRMAGVSIGHVVDVRRAGRRARLTLEVDPGFAPLRRDARVLVRNKSLLGEGYVEVAPGARKAPEVPDGGALAFANVQRAQRLDDVLQTFDPATRRAFRQSMAGMARAFDGRSLSVSGVLGRAPAVVSDLGTVVDTLNDQQQQLQQLVANASDVFDAVGSRADAVQDAVVQSRRLLDVTATRDDDLRATIAALPPFLISLRHASTTAATAAPELRRAVASLRPTVPLLQPALRSLIDDTPVFRQTFRQLPGVLRTGTTTLPALTRLLEVAGPALEPTYTGTRQLIPLLQLAAAIRGDILGAFANVASMTNGQARISQDKIRSYPAASLTVWNEIVGGWAKKLPSNRQNPYPAPSSAVNISRGGLEAYDCRNTANPLLLPATGTGVPDCKQQQPWSFQGRIASYPRLLLAPP